MKNLKGILFLAAIVALLMSANTLAASNSVLLQEVNDTTIKRAVFGAFLSDLVDENDVAVTTTVTVSNCTVAKSDLDDVVGDRDGSGAFHIYLVNADGDVFVHDSGDVDGNQGANWDGLLGPGETWTALLSEIIDGLKQPKSGALADGIFQGYAWVCSDFDCLAGSYTVTIIGVGFNQSFEFLPGMGQGGMFGGIPLP